MPRIVALAGLVAVALGPGGGPCMVDGAAPSFCSPGVGWSLEWSDEFNGAEIDAEKWTVTVGVKPTHQRPDVPSLFDGNRKHSDSDPLASPKLPSPLGAVGFNADCAGDSCVLLGSCRSAACTADNVYLENGTLVLRSQREQVRKCALEAVLIMWTNHSVVLVGALKIGIISFNAINTPPCDAHVWVAAIIGWRPGVLHWRSEHTAQEHVDGGSGRVSHVRLGQASWVSRSRQQHWALAGPLAHARRRHVRPGRRGD